MVKDDSNTEKGDLEKGAEFIINNWRGEKLSMHNSVVITNGLVLALCEQKRELKGEFVTATRKLLFEQKKQIRELLEIWLKLFMKYPCESNKELILKEFDEI